MLFIDVLRVLMEIIYKMDQIEQNQRTLSYNQSVLMKMVEEIKQDAVPKSEVLAQQHLMRECKVTLKKVKSSVRKITGEVRDKYMDEVASALPPQNVLGSKGGRKIEGRGVCCSNEGSYVQN
ncbi:uncharacterized protein [Eurosta solidaginis]|uniref:uncharacterized protein isoform X2 n=1 Tax=Eurosta solidaginis TaxID=178769 RepID=UPI003531273D